MYIYIYVCIYIFIYLYLYTHVYIYMCVTLYIYIIYTRTYLCIFVCLHIKAMPGHGKLAEAADPFGLLQPRAYPQFGARELR